jgi:hypothetical protein
MLLDFLAILIFGFVLGALILTLGPKEDEPSLQELEQLDDTPSMPDEPCPDDFQSLADMISQDKDLLKPAPPVKVPHISLPGAKIGGGAVDETCSKATATISIVLEEDASERRKYNRRMQDRRIHQHPVEDERRLIQRRVWLRREEDCKGKVLLNITDAADTLGVSIEQMYKWLDNSDIPFYQVTEGKRRALRFEINELLHWHGNFTRKYTDGGRNPKGPTI